jgi:hypothetical protein
MQDENIKIKVKTEGFEEATQEIETLAEAYDGFPAQVTIKNCHDCTFNIYPSQTKLIEKGETEDARRNE